MKNTHGVTKTRCMKKKTRLLYLPFELIIQILLRLPVRSLLRFKRVCKSWFYLISDPHFANSHIEVSAAIHTPRIRIVTISTIPVKLRSIDFETSINHDSVTLNHNFLLRQPYDFYEIKGSCRGFVFLHCHTNLHILNPSVGFHKQIPLSTFGSKLKAYHVHHLYGFGYDQSRDDYLVVFLSYYPTLAKTSSHLEFFSLRDNRWNEIEGAHVTYLNAAFHKGGSFFNGAIHWLVYCRGLSVDVIVAFDLMERKLLEMSIPDDFDQGPMYYGLWVFGEFLSLWDMNFHDHSIEIWVMKEYKLHSSWTKTLVIPIGDNILCFSPIYSTKSGDIIGNDGHRGLVKYNDKGQMLEYLQIDSNVSEVAMYTESLLSLPGDS